MKLVFRKGMYGYGHADRDAPCPVCGKYGAEVTYGDGYEEPQVTYCDNCGYDTYDQFSMWDWSNEDFDHHYAMLRFSYRHPRLFGLYANLRWYWPARFKRWLTVRDNTPPAF